MLLVGRSKWDTDVECTAQLLGRPSLSFQRVLAGGEHARTVVAGDDDGDVVVRRFPPGDTAGQHELFVTRRLATLGDLTPRLLSSHGDLAEGDLLVNELIAGTPPNGVSDVDLAIGLAGALARIHEIGGRGLREAPAQEPTGSDQVARMARDRFPKLDLSERVLTHYDFWTGNTLWRGNTLVSVVDWSGARSAPRGVDLAWARQDLVLQGRPRAAQLLLHYYRGASGQSVQDIWEWDLQAAAQAIDAVTTWSPNYVGIGLIDLTPACLESRLADWIQQLFG